MTILRGGLVVGYAAIVVAGFVHWAQPRVFWTMLLPLLPLSLVVMGFAPWRRICPLAFFGEIGRKLNRGKQHRVPRWFERWFFAILFGGLLAMLVLRLVATNGDGRWLGGLLIALAIAALATNTIFTGKTWCNFFCPVSLIERIYTEPRSLHTTANSQCARCTACKSSCPDIDQENAYWRDLETTGRRAATFAFPGLVFAFYCYYLLRHGDWEAYFDGRWTRHAVDAELWLGPGFFFAPGVPAVAAATITMVLFSAVSLLLFLLVERVARRFVEDDERRRHLMLGLAAFSAFSIFYIFAGAPSLRQVPGGTRMMAFVAPLLATLFLARRLRRTRDDFIRERGAAKLLTNWPFDEPPPKDPGEVYGWIKAREHAREQNVAAYARTAREMIADGLVRRGELRLLEGVRAPLGISEREHEKVIARLTEEELDLFEQTGDSGIAERAQLESYEAALAEALLRRASDSEVDALRQAFGVEIEAHEELLRRIRGGSGLLLDRARDLLGSVREIRRDMAALAAGSSTDAVSFLQFLLSREQDAAICRVVDMLEVIGPADRLRTLRFRLFGGDAEGRRRVVGQLEEACPVGAEIVREMAPWIVDRIPAPATVEEGARTLALELRSASSDIYLRAATIWVASEVDEPWARRIVGAGLKDADPLVRETSRRVVFGETVPTEGPFDELAILQKMQFLRGVSLFARLDPEDLHDLCGFVTEESLPEEATLCVQGDVESDDLFILLEGRAAVEVQTAEGGQREVAVVTAGEVVGEMSMIDGSPRSATVRAKEGPIRFLRISGQRFRRRLLPRSRVATPLLATLAERVRNVSR